MALCQSTVRSTLNASFIRWRDHFDKSPLLTSAKSDSFSVNGITVAATSNPDVLSFSVATELPIWLENLPTSLKLAADIQQDHPGIKVLFEDDQANDGLFIRFVHELFVNGLEDINVLFNAIEQALRGALADFCEQHANL